ncbi:MAG: hypothetical protein JTT11_07385, partial [Candidatus Brockarchaeota archaeon]|nr:hypothetical protein [Candidatus Brockarchaeota archaeon]
MKAEIARFSRGRWVGVHCSSRARDGRPILLRYDRGRPITISQENQVEQLLKRFGRLGPRTIYATANAYRKLSGKSDVSSPENIVACMPTWDVDNELDRWRATLEVAGEIRAFLEGRGIESVFVKWSGRGVHVHVHQEALSREFREKVHPLDAAYAIVEFTNSKLKGKFDEIRSRTGSG